MDLIERADFLVLLHGYFRNVTAGEGHCIFVSGEAGIGKTALVKTFCKELKSNVKFTREHVTHCSRRGHWHHYTIFSCSSEKTCANSPGIDERTELFTKFFQRKL